MADRAPLLEGGWQGENVGVAEVKAALVRSLRALTSHERSGSPHPPIRASLLNRIVRIAGSWDEVRSREALDELAELHPSRTITVETRPEEATGLDARVSIRCRLREGGEPLVCFEEVHLRARGELAAHLASVVAPLLIPEMPVVLWHLGTIPSGDDELIRLSDRIVVDSDAVGPAGLDAILWLMEQHCPNKIVTDIAWAGIATWRELLARLFDPTDARPYQRLVDRLAVRFIGGAPTTRPILMVGFVASSLEWVPVPGDTKDAAGSTYGFRTATGTALAELVQLPPAGLLRPGELLSVSLQAGQGEEAAYFAVALHEDGSCATLRSALPGRPERTITVPMGRPAWAASLSGELDRRRADTAYRACLEAVVRCMGGPGLKGTAAPTSSGGGTRGRGEDQGETR